VTRTLRPLLGLASLVVLITGLILMGSPSAQAATSGATGNAKAIAFYREMIKAMAMDGGVIEYRNNYAFVKETCTAAGGTEVSLIFDRAVIPKGYSPFGEGITLALSGGKVVWEIDNLAAKDANGFRTTGSCSPDASFTLLRNSQGEYIQGEGFASSTASLCWGTADFGIMGKLGGPVYETYGHFDPMKRIGKNELITSTFGNKNNPTTEIDTISLAIDLPISSVVKIPKEGKSPAFTVAWTMLWTGSQVQPKVTMCS
jgi:hypothetical protein